jgi:predicted PurR-regulated permease PerM
VGIAVAIIVAYVARDLVVLLILSAGLAYVINPLVKLAESLVIKRNLAVTTIYLGIALVLFAAGIFLLPHLRAEVNALAYGPPSLTERIDLAIGALQREIVAEYPASHRLFGAAEARSDRLSAFIEQQTANLPNLLTHMASIILAIVLVPVFSYLLLRDSRKIGQLLIGSLPPAHIETSVAVWCEIDRILGRYLRGLAINGVIMAVATALGLWALGVNYPLLLGALSGLANVVPYVGPVLSGGAVMLIAMIQFASFAPLAKVLTFFLLIKLFDVVLVHPMTVGKSVRLHPLLLIGSVLVGGHAFGLIGLVVAVPVVTTVQEITRLLLERRRPRIALAEFHPREGIPIQPFVC